MTLLASVEHRFDTGRPHCIGCHRAAQSALLNLGERSKRFLLDHVDNVSWKKVTRSHATSPNRNPRSNVAAVGDNADPADGEALAQLVDHPDHVCVT